MTQAPSRYALFGAPAMVTYTDLVTGDVVGVADVLKNFDIEIKGDVAAVRGGKKDLKRILFDKNIDINVKQENALIDTNLQGLVFGKTPVIGTKNVRRREVLTIVGTTVTLSKTPVGNISNIYLLNPDGTNGTAITTFTASAKTITFTGQTAGTQVVVYYYVATDAQASSTQLTKDSSGRSVGCYVDTFVKNEDDVVFQCQIHFPKVKVNLENKMNMSNSGDPSTQSLNLEVLQNPKYAYMMDITVYDENALT
ncbi:hypothetical protein AB1283_00560 [Bacillus sp. S13(2024)]|uniref:hypothetical protein n=1 Tax=Bacillus sp. S13(2024) TaxID=3162885 RepID=UPI003D21AA0A